MTSIFDAHFHILDPAFPLESNAGFIPEPFGIDDYLTRVAPLGIAGGALVSGSFQGFDQTYLLAALARLGPGFVGVTQLPAMVSDAEILRLAANRIRGVRFNLRRGGSERLEHLESFAKRVHALAAWHLELYVDAAGLAGLADRILALPAVSIDHLGLSREALPTLVRLAGRGVRVKASGFGRLDFAPADGLRAIHAANPAALMFGTDLPSTRAPRPFLDRDLDLLMETLGEEGTRRVLADNALAFYRQTAEPRAESWCAPLSA